jgi:hypothetical protein
MMSLVTAGINEFSGRCGQRNRGGLGRLCQTAAVCALVFAGVGFGAAVAQEQDKATQYAQIMQEADSLEQYDASRQQLLNSMQEQVASLQSQMTDLDAMPAAVDALLQKMYASLTQFVEADLPFLPDERRERMDRLEDVMAQEGNLSEKYRRLLEAYQIELEYGRTMSAYTGTLDDGRDVDFVRLGRVTLLYRTVVGIETGYWDAEKHAWVADQNYNRVITEALSMARELTAPDLIRVPVPAAKETRL